MDIKTDVNGTSTCHNGEESYVFFTCSKGIERVQYDHHGHNGELFLCVARSLDEARAKHNAWKQKAAA